MKKYLISSESQQVGELQVIETSIEAMPVTTEKTTSKQGCFIITTDVILEFGMGASFNLDLVPTVKSKDTKTIWVDDMKVVSREDEKELFNLVQI
jgi:ATP-dependent protease Clp ATPase subunit